MGGERVLSLNFPHGRSIPFLQVLLHFTARAECRDILLANHPCQLLFDGGHFDFWLFNKFRSRRNGTDAEFWGIHELLVVLTGATIDFN